MTDFTSGALDEAKTHVAEAIGAVLRKYCDSVHAKRARDNLHAMPPHEWGTFVTIIAEAAAVPYITAHAERDALRACAERLEADGWRPIETAPKDGTLFLIYVPEAPRRKIVMSQGRSRSEPWFRDSGYTVFDDRGNAVIATHWRPLPEPPKDAT